MAKKSQSPFFAPTYKVCVLYRVFGLCSVQCVLYCCSCEARSRW